VTPWLIILVVVGLALAPLWHFRPSPRQRQQARLREAAALAGLYVEFRELPLPPSEQARLNPVDRQVVYYGRRLPASRGKPRRAQRWWRSPDGWQRLSRDPGERRAMPSAAVAALPDAVIAASCDEHSCGVYWREDGDPALVTAMAGALETWSRELLGGSLDPH
jgi:hypothetical protein